MVILVKDGQIKASQQVTLTFFMEVCLSSPTEELSVALKDLQDNIVYKKIYTNLDYGKEINNKVTLKDIFGALSLSLSTDDQPTFVGIDNEKPENLMAYKFGDKITNRKGNNCYKIQKNGKITVYVPIQKCNNTQQIVYQQSILQLTKVKQMNQKQIINEKMQKNSKLLIEQLLTKVRKLEQQNKLLTSQFESFGRLHTITLQNLFKIKGTKLQKIGLDSSNSLYMMSETLSMDQIFTFKIKIIKSLTLNITIVLLWQEVGTQNQPTKYNGYFKNCRDFAIKINDIIQTSVNRQTATINFNINGIYQTQENYSELKNQKRIFHPSVILYNTGDIVQFC